MEIMLQHLYLLPLFISTVLSCKTYRNRWPAPYKVFSMLLLFTLCVELFAYFWQAYFTVCTNCKYTESNIWLYNSSLIPQYLLYMTVYYQVLKSKKTRKIIPGLAIVYSIFAWINMVYVQGIHSINSYTLAMADGIVIGMTIAWFDQTLREKEIIRLTAFPMFWISVGAFIFHAANLPYILSLNYLIQANLPLAIALFYIFLVLNCILYTLYTIAFLCQRPLPTS